MRSTGTAAAKHGKAAAAAAAAQHSRTVDTQHTQNMARLQAADQSMGKLRAQIKQCAEKVTELEARRRERPLDDAELGELIRLKDRKLDLEEALRRSRARNDELSYMADTACILYSYYDLVEKGGGGAPPAAAAQTPAHAPAPAAAAVAAAGGGSKPAAAAKNPASILSYFTSSPRAVTPADGGSSPLASPRGDANKAPPSAAAVASRLGAAAAAAAKPPPPAAAQLVHDPQSRGSLLERYMAATDPDFIPRGATAAAEEQCPFCRSADVTVLTNDGYQYCNACHTVEQLVTDHEKPSYRDPPKEISYFAYKRINHLNEWINQIQGKETTDIPDDLYDRILLEIKKQRISNMTELTAARLKDILKKLEANKYYEHIPHILHRLTGQPMPHLSPELEEQLRSMFRQIQAPFLKYSSNRKNFLSYSYCLHKLLQLLERDEYLPCCPLLRSRDKLFAQDGIWAKICSELGWDFVPSL